MKLKTMSRSLLPLIFICLNCVHHTDLENGEYYSELVGKWYVNGANTSNYPYPGGAMRLVSDTSYPDYIITQDSLYCFDYYSKKNRLYYNILENTSTRNPI
jgi:hypothetical protein